MKDVPKYKGRKIPVWKVPYIKDYPYYTLINNCINPMQCLIDGVTADCGVTREREGIHNSINCDSCLFAYKEEEAQLVLIDYLLENKYITKASVLTIALDKLQSK